MAVSASAELPRMSQAGTEKKNITRLIVATSIGNALEWYDITVYGYFAVYLSKAFFPNNDPSISILLTFGTFGLSYLIRPIGGVVLGAYADRYGRKASLLISIVLMTAGTLVIALMPTYESIGILAPFAVLAARHGARGCPRAADGEKRREPGQRTADGASTASKGTNAIGNDIGIAVTHDDFIDRNFKFICDELRNRGHRALAMGRCARVHSHLARSINPDIARFIRPYRSLLN